MRDYRVLIVDDDEDDRRLYCNLLSQLTPGIGHIRQAADGAVGLMALRTEPFDCVLLDFKLPDMSGLEFISTASVAGELPCAVVLITGPGNEAITVEAMTRGVQHYLVKDQLNVHNLRRAVTQAVSQTELRQRLAGCLRDLNAANLALEHEVAARKATEVELHAATKSAERANQAKTKFITMVTHEMRTPLDGILDYARLLHAAGDLSARQDTQVRAMMQAGRHLLELIESMVDTADVETGRMELHPEKMSVRDLTEACIAHISPLATEQALSLRAISAHDAPRHIVADPARLRQVLLNLLSNAVKSTDAGSVELRALAGATPGTLRFEVADTGRGIDANSRGQPFKNNEQAASTTNMEEGGLGLALASHIVKLMGGTISYASNKNAAASNTIPSSINSSSTGASNAGGVFWFELPATELVAPIRVAPIRPAAVKRSSPPSGLSILLVDDIKINLDIIGSFLHAAGHVVTMAGSGADAIKLAAERRFDLVLMDVRMPTMDGLEAARRVRMLPGFHGQVPMLALTAHTAPEQVACCLEAGMNGHVPKPVDYETLISAINKIIASLPTRRAKDRSSAMSGGRLGGPENPVPIL